MIKFDSEKISVEHVWLKSVTTGSGGRVKIVDEDLSTFDKEVYINLQSDWSVVRRFGKVNQAFSFLNPVLAAICWYEDKMVALEMNPLGSNATDEETIDGKVTKWKSQIERNVEFIKNETRDGEWFTDGYTVYCFAGGDGVSLSSDGRFSSLPALTYKFINMDNRTFTMSESRVCLKYTTKATADRPSVSAISPPIWKTLTTVGAKEMKKSGQDSEAGAAGGNYVRRNENQFDKVDELLAVNVDFALKAARDLSDVFGYEVIEPLNLDYLMVELGTVNLPTVDKSIRQTMDIGLNFSHTMAWLLGLINRSNTLEGHMAVRGVMKYLTGLGIYRKKAFDHTAVYKKDQDINSVPLMGVDEAIDAYDKRVRSMDFSEWMRLRRMEENRGKTQSADEDAGLLTAD